MLFGDCGLKVEHKFLGGCKNVFDCNDE
jgi:hypothetical protein